MEQRMKWIDWVILFVLLVVASGAASKLDEMARQIETLSEDLHNLRYRLMDDLEKIRDELYYPSRKR